MHQRIQKQFLVVVVRPARSMSGACRAREGARTYEVVVDRPETACTKLRRLCRPTSLCRAIVRFFVLFLGLCVICVMLTLSYVAFVLPCNKDLVIRLKDFTVHDMVVVHSNSTPWQVTSNINLTLALHNPNSWAKYCDFSLREVDLSVRYYDSTISFFNHVYHRHQRHSLRTSSSHEDSITLTGDRANVSDEAGEALEAQLLRNDNVTFVLDINARYRLDAPDWNRLVNHKICEVAAKMPQQGSTPGFRAFISAECGENVTDEMYVP